MIHHRSLALFSLNKEEKAKNGIYVAVKFYFLKPGPGINQGFVNFAKYGN